MRLARRFALTRGWVWVAMALTLLSYGTYKAGMTRELYPFFYWRLYSEPMGWDGATAYRLYSRPGPEAPWTRQPIRAMPAYPHGEFGYQWTYVVQDVLQDSLGRTNARERLALLAEMMAPEATEFRLVAERFDPLQRLYDPTAYDTTIVLSFAR